jgi:hypothetical protein
MRTVQSSLLKVTVLFHHNQSRTLELSDITLRHTSETTYTYNVCTFCIYICNNNIMFLYYAQEWRRALGFYSKFLAQKLAGKHVE